MFDLLVDFLMPFSFFFLVHKILPTFVALRLDFSATKLCFTVLGLTSNMVVNKQSDFLSLGYFTGVDVMGTLGLLSVTPSGVDSTAA